MIAIERHWLSKLCVSHPRMSWAARVVRVVAVGGWSMATDLHGLVAVKDGGAAAEPGDGLTAAKAETAVRLIDAAPPDRPVLCEPDDLAEWCRWPRPRACPRCQGAKLDPTPDAAEYIGAEPVEVNGEWGPACLDCDGTGKDDWKPRPGVVAGVMVSRRLLGRLLMPQLSGGDCAVWGSAWRGITSDTLHLRGTTTDGLDWRAALMGVNGDPNDDDVKYAPHYVPGVGRLWHLIEENTGRGVVSDWLLDQGLDIETVHPLPI